MSDVGFIALIIAGILVLIAAIKYGFLGTLLEVLFNILVAVASSSSSSKSSSDSSSKGSGFGGGRSGGGGSSSDW